MVLKAAIEAPLASDMMVIEEADLPVGAADADSDVTSRGLMCCLPWKRRKVRHIWKDPIVNGQRIVPVLARAQGRMFSIQYSLPRLPVPTVQQTLDKFLLSVRPTLTDEEFAHAEKVVAEFGKPGADAEKLNKLLQEKANTTINWLSKWWLHAAYLDYRIPVPIHSNPGITFPKMDYSDQEGQLRAAAKMISGILDYKVMIDDQSLPVEQLGGKPLCMMQFYNILSSCRIPGKKSDTTVNFPPDMPDAPRHIIVAHNNHFFSMVCYGSNGDPLTIDQLYAQLTRIVERSKVEGVPLGILTTDNRNSWGKIYTKIIQDKHNLANMEAIQRSIFMVCIDEKKNLPHDDVTSFIAGQMNHGWGSKGNSANRWFDKTMQFIVGADGAMGVNYEHAPAEGPPIISVVDHTLNYMSKDHPKATPVPGMLEPQRLKFNLHAKVDEAIENATRGFDATIADLDMNSFAFDTFGKEFIKGQKFSPDAFIQMAIQLAYYKLYGRSCATYESGSLRRFQHGRTETIRSASIASLNYCKTMCDFTKSTSEKAKALGDAITSHRNYTNDVVNGNGIDRHLLGLKLIAIESGQNVPDFFMDPTYTSSVHWQLSTSQVPSKHNAVLCFGPVVPDGYGICYNPMPYAINFSVSAWNSSPDTDSHRMKRALVDSLVDTQTMLLQNQKVDSKL